MKKYPVLDILKSALMCGFALVILTPHVAAAQTRVHAGDDLQAVIDSARCGDVVMLDAGVTWTGNFKLPNKGCSTYVTITSSGSLPPVGTRITPAASGQLGKIVTDNVMPAVDFCFSAGYYQFVGVEIASSYTLRTYETYNVVLSGYNCDAGATPATVNSQLPDHVIFDRVYIHGTHDGNVTRGLYAAMGSLEVKNSYIAEIHTLGNADTNCILTVNGRGPYLIDNNYLNCAGENFMAGGGGDPTIPNQILDGLTFTNNYVTKDVSWYPNAAAVGGTYGGTHWSVKNAFELKSAKNVLVDHNIFENVWQDAQVGNIILMQAINQTGICTWCTVANVTFTNNIVRHGNMGMSLAGNVQQTVGEARIPITADTLLVRNNLFYDLHGVWSNSGETPGAGGMCANIGYGFKNVVFDHNTCDNDAYAIQFNAYHGGIYDQMTNLVIKNNVVRGNLYGVFGSNTAPGTGSLNAYANTGYTFLNNVIATDQGPGAYPPTTDQPSIATFQGSFVHRAIGHLDNAIDYTIVSGSPYKAGASKQASDLKDVGVDMKALLSGAAQQSSSTPAAPGAPTNVRISQ